MAATIIDALVVTLGIDAKDFKKKKDEASDALIDAGKTAEETVEKINKAGASVTQFFLTVKNTTNNNFKQTNDNAARTSKEMQARGKVAGEFFSNIKAQALGLLTVLIGGKGIAGFATDAVNSLAAMGRAARNIGVSVPELAAFRNTIAANGGSADAAAASFQHLSDEMESLKVTGQSAALPFLNMIGGQRGETAMQTYMRFVQFATEHANDPQLIRKIGAGLGLDEGSINEAGKGVAQVKRDLADAAKRGLPTQEMTARMAALQAAFIKARQAADNLGNVLLDRFAPALTVILDTITAFIEAHPTAATAIGVGATVGGGVVAGKVVTGIAKGVLGAAGGAAVAGGAAAGAAGAGAAGAAGAGAAGATAGGIVLRAAGAAARLAGPVGWGLMALEFLRGNTTNAGEEDLLRQQREAGRPSGATPGLPPSALFNAIESRNRLPGGLLDSVWNAESARGRNMLSPAGARGHFQFMGPTARQYGVADPNDLSQSANGAGRFFADLLRHYGGDQRKAIAGYNWGQGNLDRNIAQFGAGWESHLPAETKTYLARVSQGLVPGARLAANQNTAGGTTQTVNVSGPITVNTQATDARGVATALRGELAGRRLVAQANTGVS